MKTYNLIATSLYAERDGEDCFCALGIYAAEKAGVEKAKERDYQVFLQPEHVENLTKMAEFLAPDVGGWDRDTDYYLPAYEIVYHANDKSVGGCQCSSCDAAGRGGPLRFEVPAEKIREALALVGIDVKLNDWRAGKPE